MGEQKHLHHRTGREHMHDRARLGFDFGASASRTSTPVIRLISCRNESAESLNNWR